MEVLPISYHVNADRKKRFYHIIIGGKLIAVDCVLDREVDNWPFEKCAFKSDGEEECGPLVSLIPP